MIVARSGTKSEPSAARPMPASSTERRTPGVIVVRAYAEGLKSSEAHLASTAASLPLAFDATYAASSKSPSTGSVAIVRGGASGLPGDVTKLQEEVQRLRREVTSKEQDIMELRSKVGK
jgi:beta-galactosidase